ncbi:holin, SPP1 family [Jeotgalibacillus malaysiensis]|uniref:Holin, SPP1 family n=1 Tax=Jeotgalibacillus malaysiensis TaxID=1508404 RepID=A0A0B5ATW6_9BACL|nr:phage holin [Jeotgalibacillus malaysiensis]AJD92018.1 holin, SPP1 family [Jeotgalibacillus malaysiensis]
MKKSTAGHIRLGVLLFALINQGLVLAGYSPLPFSDQEVELFLSTVFTAVSSMVAWWYNNPVTKQGKAKEGE